MNYKNMDWLLGGSFESPDEYKGVRRESLIEALSFFVGKISTMEINESDSDDLAAFDIEDELSEMENLFERIQEKLFINDINENSDVLVTVLPAAVATLMGGIGLGTALFQQWVKEGTVLPKFLYNAEYKLGKFLGEVTGAELAKRRGELAAQIRKENPKASPIEIKAAIARIEADYKRKAEYKPSTYVPPKDSAKHGTHDPEVGQVMRKHLALQNMTPKEKEAYNRKRFPGKGK